jgi:hypothetical protein
MCAAQKQTPGQRVRTLNSSARRSQRAHAIEQRPTRHTSHVIHGHTRRSKPNN